MNNVEDCVNYLFLSNDQSYSATNFYWGKFNTIKTREPC